MEPKVVLVQTTIGEFIGELLKEHENGDIELKAPVKVTVIPDSTGIPKVAFLPVVVFNRNLTMPIRFKSNSIVYSYEVDDTVKETYKNVVLQEEASKENLLIAKEIPKDIENVNKTLQLIKQKWYEGLDLMVQP